MLKIPESQKARIESLTKEFQEHFANILNEPVRITISIHPANVSEALIRHLVCEAFEVKWSSVLRQNRTREVAAARQCYCYLCSKYLMWAPAKIGLMIERDRTTSIHSVTAIENHLKTGEPLIAEKLIPIINELKELSFEKV